MLNGISFRADGGEKVAIVGPSGSGKTTLVNLIPRFYELSEGSIFIDGKDIRNAPLTNLRSQIAIVPQDVMLFSGTIIENIRSLVEFFFIFQCMESGYIFSKNAFKFKTFNHFLSCSRHEIKLTPNKCNEEVHRHRQKILLHTN